MTWHIFLLITLFFQVKPSSQLSIADEVMAFLESSPVFANKADLLAHYHKFFNQQWSKSIDEICKPCNTDRKRLDADIQKYTHTAGNTLKEIAAHNLHDILLEKGYLEADPRIIKIAQEVLAEYGLTRDRHHIYAHPHEQSVSILESGLIVVNNEFLKKLSDHDLRAAIAHEAQHIIFNDVPTDRVIHQQTCLLPNDALRARYTQLCEIRADVFAALHSPYYAEALMHFFNRLKLDLDLNKQLALGQNDQDMHSASFDFRVKTFQTILQQLEVVQ